MMMNQRPAESVVNYMEQIIDLVKTVQPELSKRGISYDHKDIMELMQGAVLYNLMLQILAEMQVMNRSERMKQFPLSALNQQGK